MGALRGSRRGATAASDILIESTTRRHSTPHRSRCYSSCLCDCVAACPAGLVLGSCHVFCVLPLFVQLAAVLAASACSLFPLLALPCLSFSFLSAVCLGIGIDSGCGRINDLARGACGVLLDSSSSSQQQPSNRNNNTHSHTYREREKKGHSALPALSSFPLCPSKLRQLLLGSLSCPVSSLPRLASSVLV